MDQTPEIISSQTSVEEVVRDVFLQRHRRVAAVYQDDQLVGIVTITDVKRQPQQKWAQTPVGEIMTRQPLYSVGMDDGLNSALRLLVQHDLNQLLVLKEGRLVGFLNRADIIRYLQLSQELGMGSK